MQYDALLEMFGQKVSSCHDRKSHISYQNLILGGRVRRVEARPRRSEVNFTDPEEPNQRADAAAERLEANVRRRSGILIA